MQLVSRSVCQKKVNGVYSSCLSDRKSNDVLCENFSPFKAKYFLSCLGWRIQRYDIVFVESYANKAIFRVEDSPEERFSETQTSLQRAAEKLVSRA